MFRILILLMIILFSAPVNAEKLVRGNDYEMLSEPTEPEVFYKTTDRDLVCENEGFGTMTGMLKCVDGLEYTAGTEDFYNSFDGVWKVGEKRRIKFKVFDDDYMYIKKIISVK